MLVGTKSTVVRSLEKGKDTRLIQRLIQSPKGRALERAAQEAKEEIDMEANRKERKVDAGGGTGGKEVNSVRR